MTCTLMPTQTRHHVGAHPAVMHLLRKGFTQCFDLRDVATAEHSADNQLLQAVAVAVN